LSAAEISERHALAKFFIAGIASQNCAGAGVYLRHNERRCGFAAGAKHPFDIGRNAKNSGPAGLIGNLQARDFNRIINRHKLYQVQ
jgi:hypothetical protein